MTLVGKIFLALICLLTGAAIIAFIRWATRVLDLDEKQWMRDRADEDLKQVTSLRAELATLHDAPPTFALDEETTRVRRELCARESSLAYFRARVRP